MQEDEDPVRSLAAVALELNAMAEGKHFDFERMNSIMAEMAHAKVCLERNRERRSRCNSRTDLPNEVDWGTQIAVAIERPGSARAFREQWAGH